MKDLETQYVKNQDFVFRKIHNETILVPIKDNVGDMGCIYNLNEVGAFVWEHINGKNRLTDIKNRIADEFDVSPEKAEEDLFHFISQLTEIDAIRQND